MKITSTKNPITMKITFECIPQETKPISFSIVELCLAGGIGQAVSQILMVTYNPFFQTFFIVCAHLHLGPNKFE